jgi:hypothetical protein
MSYPRETKELQPFQVKVDGVEVLTGVKVAVIRPSERPTVWTTPVTLVEGGLAVLIDQLDLGVWNVWAQVTTEDTDEVVVVLCGDFKII